ncbi:hypothetical protein PM082_019348 [Marasmius tenuissimus]|nr:hypothetical protein PM082_019348 [Marasmius tenuissimus]
MGCSKILTPEVDTGISVAAVFGVEWLFDAFNLLGSHLDFAHTRLRRILGPTVSCEICGESIWVGEVVICSQNAHHYCTECLSRTVEGMLLGDLALKYDEATTKPLCCFCFGETVSTIPVPTATLTRRWDRRIISLQLQNLGLPLLKCVHCGYIVIDEEVSTSAPTEPSTSSPSLRRRFLSFIGVETSKFKGRERPRQFPCPQCSWSTCTACSTAVPGANAPVHRCKTDDLRLTIEREVSQRLVYTCPRPSCGQTLLKEGGCNHCTCVCGNEYCHLCHENFGDDQNKWRYHYCGHLVEEGSMASRSKDGRCALCGKCRLYEDRDDEVIRRGVEERVTKEWKRKQFWKGVKSWVGLE